MPQGRCPTGACERLEESLQMLNVGSEGQRDVVPVSTPRRAHSAWRWFAAMVAFTLLLSACGSSEEASTEAPSEVDAQADDTTQPHDDHDDDDDHDGSGLGAHEHGSAQLSVAWIGADIAVDLISPTQNVIGFEYEPETEEDRSTAAERTEAIATTGMVTINEAAACEQTGPVTTETEREGSHSEITVSWLFTCDNPDEINEVDLTALFAEFPAFEDIDAEWVSETDQSAAELSPERTTLRLGS